MDTKNKIFSCCCKQKAYCYLEQVLENHPKSKAKLKGYYTKTRISMKRYGKERSDNSYTFEIHGHDPLEFLNDFFETNISREHWNEAVKGQGHEEMRITTMHSSALLSLLFFHSVSDKNPLRIKVANQKLNFTRVVFEKENACIALHRPSSIDVMLVDDKSKTVLFLESKFSEFLRSGKKKLSREYLLDYGDMWSSDIMPESLEIIKEGEEVTIQEKEASRCTHYCEGIKQMICHFIGSVNFKKDDENYSSYTVLLGTVLLDLSYAPACKVKYDGYARDYAQLAGNINGLGKDVKMLDNVITYQDLYKEAKENGYVISDVIASYYGLV